MGKKPVIGITAGFTSKVGPRGSFYQGGDYVKSVMQAGGCPVLLSVTEDPALVASYLDTIDGFLVPGGGDLAPHLYGEDPVPGVNHFNMIQDVFEMQLIKGCVAAKKPMLGVCRGMQLMNVAFGGSMIQDIPSQCKSPQSHFGSMESRDEPYHWVDLTPDSRIAKILGSEKIMTNSYHHQAIKDVARGFTVTGTSADGIIEAFESEQYDIVAVQFHPENLAQRFSDFLKLFEDLVKRCK